MKKILGFNKTVINIKEDNNFDDIVGVIYPGQTYSLNAPSLFYLHQIFEKYRIHYFGINLQYGINTEFIIADSQTRTKWIDIDSELIGEYVKKETIKFKRRVFIAKSLGTAHLYNQIKQNYITKSDVLIFQTPIIPFEELQDMLIQKGNESLIIYGTKDAVMIKQRYNRIKTKNNVCVFEIENAGHAFEEEDKIEESINNLKNVMLETERFLAKILL